MKKKLLAITLAAIMTVGLAACGGGNTTSESASSASDTKVESVVEESAASSAEETASASESAGGADLASTEGEMTGDYASLVSSQLPKGDWKLGFANGYFGNTWRAQFVECFEGFAEALKEAGVIGDYTVASTNADVTEQLNQVNQMISEGVDCILINPVSPASVTPIKQLCDQAGVLLVVDTDPAAVDADLIEVLVDNRGFFEVMAKWFVTKMTPDSKFVQITGTPGMPATVVRQAVADRILGEAGLTSLGSAPGSWDETEAQTAMATFLSTYDQIDGVLTEDVMAEGILHAFETAGRDYPIMTGDYVMSFFRKWETIPELDSCASTFQPHGAIEGVQYAIRVLNGWELDTSLLGTNPLDESMVNAINIAPAVCVTKDGITDADEWAKGYNDTKFLSLQEALELGADLSDASALGANLSGEWWDKAFGH